MKKGKAVIIAILFIFIVLSPRATHAEPIDFNRGWKFARVERGGVSPWATPVALDFDDAKWEDAVLPHTARIEPLEADRHFQGRCWYRRRFPLDKSLAGKKIFLQFEAAMHTAEVWVNGKPVFTHHGGYLPFTIDVTGLVSLDRENIIALRLDNRDEPDVPPGKPLRTLDFCYFGGLYRGASLVVADPLHITDPILADKPAGGGVFVTYENVSPESATVRVKTHVQNQYPDSRNALLLTVLIDDQGNEVNRAEASFSISAGDDREIEQTVLVNNPRLWSPDEPNLYRLLSVISRNGQTIDSQTTRIGIRTIEIRYPDGFFINGKPLRIRGTNRHQEYPYLGNAMPDNAQYRDAVKLKDAGFNLVRAAHYPQSPAFLDACDELGIMVIEATPGWQHYRNNGAFRGRVLQNIRDMVRRDRNRPSMVFWEVSLNETSAAPYSFFRECHLTAHAELPGDQMITCGDTDGRKDPASIGFDLPFGQWDQARFQRGLWSVPGKMGYPREYGDFEFGGNKSTSRAFRGDGQTAMLLQAWNFQWSHNRNLAEPSIIGDGNWVFIDYNRGYMHSRPICAAGLLDIFRLPKFVHYFYMSQRDPAFGPMVFIADYWLPKASPAKVVVYSNCDEVELSLNGKTIARQTPDSGPDSDYENAGYFDPNYWRYGGILRDRLRTLYEPPNWKREVPEAVNMFDGGNARHIDHPPFTFFNVTYEPGELKATGFIKGEPAAEYTVRTPAAPASLRLSADLSGKPLAAGNDAIFIRTEIIDANGTVVPAAQNAVSLTITGPASIIGPQTINAEAGIASLLLRSSLEPGQIQITASSPGLDSSEINLSSQGTEK